MSYAESQLQLTAADAALTQGQWRQAANHYAAVVAGLSAQADPLRPLTPTGTALVVQYATASRGRWVGAGRWGAAARSLAGQRR